MVQVCSLYLSISLSLSHTHTHSDMYVRTCTYSWWVSVWQVCNWFLKCFVYNRRDVKSMHFRSWWMLNGNWLGNVYQTWSNTHKQTKKDSEMMWSSFWWRNSVSGEQQKFLLVAAASYKHWRITSGQLMAIMMCSTNKASPFPLLLENSLHTIAQKPQSIVSNKEETCLVWFWDQYRHTCSIVSKGCTGTERTGESWKWTLKKLHKPLLSTQAICRRAEKRPCSIRHVLH